MFIAYIRSLDLLLLCYIVLFDYVMFEIVRIGRLIKIVKPVAVVIMVVKGAVDVVSFAVIENNIPRVPDSVIALALLACNDFALTVTDDFIIQQIKCARIARADCFAAYQRAVCAAGNHCLVGCDAYGHPIIIIARVFADIVVYRKAHTFFIFTLIFGGDFCGDSGGFL